MFSLYYQEVTTETVKKIYGKFGTIRDGSKCFLGRFQDGGETKLILIPAKGAGSAFGSGLIDIWPYNTYKRQ